MTSSQGVPFILRGPVVKFLTFKKAAAVHEPPERLADPKLLISAIVDFICLEYKSNNGILHNLSPAVRLAYYSP